MNFNDEIILYFENLLKFFPLISGLFLFIVSGFKTMMNYMYGKNCEETFGIPYSYFSFDFIKSIIETIIYAFILFTCIFIMAWVLFLNISEEHPFNIFLYVLLFFVIFALFQMTIFIDNKDKKKIFCKFIIIIPFLTTIFIFVFQKYFIMGFIMLTILLFFYVFSIVIYKIYKHFTSYVDPKNEKYQIISKFNNRYAIVAKTKDLYVLIKLDNNDKILKSDFVLTNNISDIPIQYKKIF